MQAVLQRTYSNMAVLSDKQLCRKIMTWYKNVAVMLPIVLVRRHELNAAIKTKNTDEGAHGCYEDGRKEER